MFKHRRKVILSYIRLRLEIGFNKLHLHTKHEEILFWGKLIGLKGDYYIVLGIDYTNHFEFPLKTFYWASSSNYEFSILPETYPLHDKDMRKHSNSYLFGIASTILEKYEEDVDQDAVPQDPVPEQTENVEGGQIKERDPLDDTIEIEVKIIEKKINFTELSKISYLVRNIDHDTNIIPEGAFKIIPIHELRRNETFNGLNQNELTNLNKYQHFRQITNPKIKEIIESDDAIFRTNILESIAEDRVRGSWSTQLDPTKQIVIFNN
jgi:hypothetical protein